MTCQPEMLQCSSPCNKDTLPQSQTTPKKSNHSCMLSNNLFILMLSVVLQISFLTNLQLIRPIPCYTPLLCFHFSLEQLPCHFFFNYDIDFWERPAH